MTAANIKKIPGDSDPEKKKNVEMTQDVIMDVIEDFKSTTQTLLQQKNSTVYDARIIGIRYNDERAI